MATLQEIATTANVSMPMLEQFAQWLELHGTALPEWLFDGDTYANYAVSEYDKAWERIRLIYGENVPAWGVVLDAWRNR